MIKLPDWRDPIVFALLVVLAISAVLNIIQRVQLGSARDALATMTAARDEALRDSGALENQRDELQRANEALARMVQTQGAAIVAMKTDADQRQARAANAARQVLSRPPRLADGHGAEAMNAWLRDFSSP